MTIAENMREAEIRPSVCFHSAPRHYLPTEENDWQVIDIEENSMTDDLCEKYLKKLWFVVEWYYSWCVYFMS